MKTMTTIYPGFTFTEDYDLHTYICLRDNGCGVTYCEEFELDDEGEEVSLGERRLTHHEIAHAIRVKRVEWCNVSPDQWDVILSKVSEDVLEEILGNDRDYSGINVAFLLQEGNKLFDGFNEWLLSELDIYNRYDR